MWIGTGAYPQCHGRRHGSAARDAEHPHNFALLAGPFVLMRILDDRLAPALNRAFLLAATPVASRAEASHGDAILRSFADIGEDVYAACQTLACA